MGRNTNGRQRLRPGPWVNVCERKLQLRSLLLLWLLLMLSFIYKEWSKNVAIWHSVAIYTFTLNTYVHPFDVTMLCFAHLVQFLCCFWHIFAFPCLLHHSVTVSHGLQLLQLFFSVFHLFKHLMDPLAPLSYTLFCFGLSSLLPIVSFLPFTVLHHFVFHFLAWILSLLSFV